MAVFGDPRAPINKHFYPHDFIEFFILVKADFSKEFAEKYEKGNSVAEIARVYKVSKSHVLKSLNRANIKIRPNKSIKTCNARGKTGNRPFYGFCYSEGKLVQHPQEFPILQAIHAKWLQGISAHYIFLDLNKRKVKSREKREWSWAAVSNLLKRFESKKIVIKGKTFRIN